METSQYWFKNTFWFQVFTKLDTHCNWWWVEPHTPEKKANQETVAKVQLEPSRTLLQISRRKPGLLDNAPILCSISLCRWNFIASVQCSPRCGWQAPMGPHRQLPESLWWGMHYTRSLFWNRKPVCLKLHSRQVCLIRDFQPSTPLFLFRVLTRTPVTWGLDEKITLISDFPVDIFLFFHISCTEYFMKMFSLSGKWANAVV